MKQKSVNLSSANRSLVEPAVSVGKVTTKDLKYLAFLFLAMVITHTAFAHALILHPKFVIDEPLYADIARSIAIDHRILYRGQPANYSYIFYPLVLSPLYAIFGQGTDFYRLIQFWNAVLMSLSLFPLFALAKSFTNDAKKSFKVAFLFSIMPDTLLNGYILSESVIYPLFFTVVFLGYKYILNHKFSYVALIGVLGGLLYETKPGHIVPAVVFLLVCLFFSVRDKKLSCLLHCLAGLLCLSSVLVLFHFLTRSVLHFQSGNSFTLYSEQINIGTDWDTFSQKQLPAFLKGIVLSVNFFILACGGLCVLLPLKFLSQYSTNQKTMFFCISAALLAMILGTAWAVNRVEYKDFAIHTRYFAMYIPLFVLFSVSIPSPSRKRAIQNGRLNKATLLSSPVIVILVLYVVLCTSIFGVNSANPSDVSRVSIISNLALCILRLIPSNLTIFITILVVCFIVYLFYSIQKSPYLKLRRVSFVMIVIHALNLFAFGPQQNYANFIVPSTNVINDAIDDNSAIIVTQSNSPLINHILFDVNNKNTNTIITITDLFNSLSVNNGVYRPYKPEVYRGMASTTDSPDLEYFVFNYDAVRYIKFNSRAQILVDLGNSLSLVKLPRGEIGVESVMGGISNSSLPQGSTGYLRVFDTTATSARLDLDIEMSSPGTLTVTCCNQEVILELEAGKATYSVDLEGPSLSVISLLSPDSNVGIVGYDLVFGS